MRLDALRRHIDQIGQMHYEKIRKRPDRHTMVKRTLDSVKRRQDIKKQPPAPPLFRDEDFLAAKTPKVPRPREPRKTATSGRALRAKPPLVRRKRV